MTSSGISLKKLRVTEFLKGNALVVSALIAFLSIGILYIKKNFVNAPFEDGILMVPFLGKYFTGKLSFHDIARPFGEHRLIGYHIIFLLNTILFHLNMKIEPLLCLLSYFFVGVLLYFPYKQFFNDSSDQAGSSRNLWIQISYISILFSIFSLAHPPMILMATQFTIGTAVFVLAALFFDQLCLGNVRWSAWAAYLICMAVYLSVFSGAYFGGALFSLLSCLVFKTIFSEKREENFPLLAAMALTLIMMAGYLLLTRTAGGGLAPKIELFVSRPWETFESLLAGLSASTLDIHTFTERLRGSKEVVLINGGFLFLLGIYALARFVVLKMYKISYLPILLMMYTVGAILTIRLGRLNGGWGQPLAEWYSFHMSYYLIGVLWIIYYDLFQRMNVSLTEPQWNKKWGGSAAALSVLALLIVFSVQGYADVRQWKRIPYNHAWYEAKRQALLFPDKHALDTLDLSSFSTEDELLKDITILKEHRLSCFYGRAPDDYSVTVGNNLQTAKLISGWYGWEGNQIWMGKKSEAYFLTGPLGMMNLAAYFPDRYIPNGITLFIDGRRLKKYKIKTNRVQINAEGLPQNSIVKLEIVVDKSFVPLKMGWDSDGRDLGLLVSNIKFL